MIAFNKSSRAFVSIVTLFSFLLMASCGGDKDPGPTSKLVGKWQVMSTDAEITVPGGATLVAYLVSLGLEQEIAEVYAAELESGDALEVSGTIEFNNDGKYGAVDGSDVTNGTWELSSDEKILLLDRGTGGETSLEVNKLNDTELVLDADLTEDLDFPPNTIEYHGILTLKRL